MILMISLKDWIDVRKQIARSGMQNIGRKIQNIRHRENTEHKTRDSGREEDAVSLEFGASSPISIIRPMVFEGPDVFEIIEEPEEEPEEAINDRNHDDTVEKLELLRAEMLKLGKTQMQARMFAKSEYQAIREAIEAFSTNNDHTDNHSEMIIQDLFSIADGLDAGFRAGETVFSSEMGSWLDGIKITHQRVMELLERLDVHPLYSVGKPFDPSLHVAVAVESMKGVDDNIILEEQRRGYVQGDKVIRYAEVIVNKRSLELAEQVEEDDG